MQKTQERETGYDVTRQLAVASCNRQLYGNGPVSSQKANFSSTQTPNLIGNLTYDYSTTWTSILNTISMVSTLFNSKINNQNLIPIIQPKNNNMLNHKFRIYTLWLLNVSLTLTLDRWTKLYRIWFSPLGSSLGFSLKTLLYVKTVSLTDSFYFLIIQ